ncbi:hypothetical protein C900_02040 [Fulvivirga imtechensis AK7]|uniref:Uncharacterized protein n=1 Tax=Fulvivirga imtechensis AK7 TaxID=1237149 RepID=L8JX29_9BACT|nr:hypothetical protein C900_02040 [Fulvivirga imtechensis AK7]
MCLFLKRQKGRTWAMKNHLWKFSRTPSGIKYFFITKPTLKPVI